MYEVGRVCIKLAGRDAGREAVVVDVLDEKYVLIDGNVRRRKCNVLHLEPTSKKIEIKKKAGHDEVKAAFEKINLGTWETKPRKAAEKPKKQRGKKDSEEKPVKETKKKAAKKIVKEAEIVEEKAEKAPKKEAAPKSEKKPAVKKKAAKKE